MAAIGRRGEAVMRTSASPQPQGISRSAPQTQPQAMMRAPTISKRDLSAWSGPPRSPSTVSFPPVPDSSPGEKKSGGKHSGGKHSSGKHSGGKTSQSKDGFSGIYKGGPEAGGSGLPDGSRSSSVYPTLGNKPSGPDTGATAFLPRSAGPESEAGFEHFGGKHSSGNGFSGAALGDAPIKPSDFPAGRVPSQHDVSAGGYPRYYVRSAVPEPEAGLEVAEEMGYALFSREAEAEAIADPETFVDGEEFWWEGL